MRLLKVAMTGVAVASLMAAPAYASQQRAAQVSSQAAKSDVRKGEDLRETNQLSGGGGVIVGVLALGAIVAGIIVAVDGKNDSPQSP